MIYAMPFGTKGLNYCMKVGLSLTYHQAGNSLNFVTTYLKEYLNTIDKEEDNNNEQQHSIAAIENMCVKTLQTINH